MYELSPLGSCTVGPSRCPQKGPKRALENLRRASTRAQDGPRTLSGSPKKTLDRITRESGACLGPLLGPSWALRPLLGPSWSRLGPLLEPPGGILETLRGPQEGAQGIETSRNDLRPEG